MKVLDINLLLYAINRESPHHAAARSWLEHVLSGEETVGFPWVVILGFVRLSTSPRVFPSPLSTTQALGVVDGWLARPCALIPCPGEDHWRILKDLLAGTGAAGNLTTDTHLAALAIESGAELISTDTDFARFPRLRWTNPLQG